MQAVKRVQYNLNVLQIGVGQYIHLFIYKCPKTKFSWKQNFSNCQIFYNEDDTSVFYKLLLGVQE